jgi:CCR4-NOT transcription complex subunit 1
MAIDEALSGALQMRQAHRETSGAAPFFDRSYLSGRYPAALPEALRPTPGGLQARHARVYDDFSRAARLAQMAIAAGQPAPVTAAPVVAAAAVIGGMSAASRGDDAKLGYALQRGTMNSADSGPGIGGGLASQQQQQPAAELLQTPALVQQLNALLSRLDAVLERLPANTQLSSLAADHDVSTLWRQVVALLGAAAVRAEAGTTIARRLFVRVYERNAATLRRDVHLAMLDGVRRRMPDLPAQLTQWLLALDGERRFQRDVTLALVRANMLAGSELDRHVAELLLSNDDTPEEKSTRRAAIDFAASLFALGLAERGSVPLGDYPRTLAALSALSAAKRAPAALSALVDDVRRSGMMGVHAAISVIVGRVPVGSFASATLPDAGTLARDQVFLSMLLIHSAVSRYLYVYIG